MFEIVETYLHDKKIEASYDKGYSAAEDDLLDIEKEEAFNEGYDDYMDDNY